MAAVSGARARLGLAAASLAVVLGVAAACTPPNPGPSGSTGASLGPIGFTGHALAGPVCPVVRPNDPACADRPVAGATIHVLDASGTEIARLVTDATGGFGLAVPAGTYRLVADPVQGVMGTPGPVDIEVGDGIRTVDLAYDTGIR